MRKNKFMPGEKIITMDELEAWTKSGGWIYLGKRPKHFSFVISMQYQTVSMFVSSGSFRKAVLNQEK